MAPIFRIDKSLISIQTGNITTINYIGSETFDVYLAFKIHKEEFHQVAFRRFGTLLFSRSHGLKDLAHCSSTAGGKRWISRFEIFFVANV